MKRISIIILLLIISNIIFSQQQCIQPPPGIISWWTGDKDSTDFLKSFNCILVNGTTIETGIVDSAFSFDGIDDYIEVPDTSAFDMSSGEFSIDFWVKPNNCTVASSDAIPFVTKESPNQYEAYTIGITPGEEFIFAASDDLTSYKTVVRGGSCNVGEWHLIAVTQSDSVAKLYVNGVVVDIDSSATNPINTDFPLCFGFREDVSSNPGLQTRYFDGMLDEIDFFDRALTETEILEIFNADSAGKCKCECMPLINCNVIVYDTIKEHVTIYDTTIIYDHVTIHETVYDTIKVYDHITVTDTLIIDLATNINYTDEDGLIKVYPNPAKTFISVNIQKDSDLFNSIRLLNNSGQIIRERNCDQMLFNMDISDLSPGLYLIQVLDNNQTVIDTKKLILK